MAFGLVVYDVLYLTLATLLYGGASLAAVTAFTGASRVVPWWVALFPSVLAGLLALILEVGALSAMLPRLRPGRYRMMKGAIFYSWLLRALLRRILFFPGAKAVLFQSNVLRFLALRALGARAAFTASMSSDVELLDPALVRVGPGAVIGARCMLSGHYVEAGLLILGGIDVGEKAMLSIDVVVGPGVTIGDGATIQAQAALNARTTVGERAVIGYQAVLDSGAEVAARARVPPRHLVAKRARFE